ncbi:MAG: c-type cytochrome [Pelagimonas sp.]|uniref:c-type cytochrome n=1 Tax=Pelagimonas sp. TaxID=2073170 RepID=UPI003D6AD6F3
MRFLAPLISLVALWVMPAVAQEFTTLKGHGGPIMDIAVAPDGTVVTASFDNSVGVWRDGVPTWLEGHEAAVVAIDASSQPGVLSGGDDFRVLSLHPEISTEDLGVITKHMGKVSDVAYSPETTYFASASWDGTIHLVSVGEYLLNRSNHGVPYEARVLTGHSSGVTSIGFLRDDVLFSASSDGTVRIWERKNDSFESRPIVKQGFGINELIVSDDWLAYGAVDGGTRIVHPVTGEQIADFTLDRRPILSMAYHADTDQLAVGDGHGYIMMIDTTAWKITRDFRATRKGPVWALAFSNDGKTIWAGGLDDVAYGWPVDSLDKFDPAMGQDRSFLKAADTMPNGERQFMRKCSICHALEEGPSRKAGPTMHGIFGRRAGTVPGYSYSDILDGSDIIWDETTIDALFDQGPDHYIPGSKMPMQVIAKPQDRADLITFLKDTTVQGD